MFTLLLLAEFSFFSFLLTQLMRSNKRRDCPGQCRWASSGIVVRGPLRVSTGLPGFSQGLLSSRPGSRDLHCRQAHTQTCPDTMGPLCCPGHATPQHLLPGLSLQSILPGSANISPPLSSQPQRGMALCSTGVNKDHHRNVCKFVNKFPGSIFPSSRMPQFCAAAVLEV